jgi:hypothetical protein
MTFRNQQDHLIAKNAVLEEQLREVEERAALTAENHEQERQKELEARRRARWASFFDHGKTFSLAALLAAVLTGAVYGLYAYGVAQKIDVTREHQRALAELRAHVPSGVNRTGWLWCVDHCARFGAKSAHGRLASEGIVFDTFADYGDGVTPVFRVSIGGPWLDREGHIYRSYTVASEDTDPPGTKLRVGDKVRITEDYHGERVAFIFKVEAAR